MEENIVSIIENILDTEWVESNAICGDDALCGDLICGVENPKPRILRQWNPKRVDFAKEDGLILYETSGMMREAGDITYFSEDVTGFVSIDIRTITSEKQFDAIYDELERIRKLKRKNPHVDYDRWDFIRKTLFHRPLSWRGVVDYKLSRANVAL